jgi:uncharacterized protein YodC (DUF2158 family)
MANFKKGDVVKVVATVPQGPVESMRMTEDGDVMYMISWTDTNGAVQTRWFDEAQLTVA